MILLGIGGRERDDGGFGFVGCSQGVGGRAVVVVHRDAVGMGLLVFIWGGGGFVGGSGGGNFGFAGGGCG